MPAALDAGDRAILIAGALLMVAMLVVSLATVSASSGPPGFPCSHFNGPDGGRAAYLLLGSLGYRVIRWERPPAELPADAGNTVLIVAAPLLPVTRGMHDSIRNFVAAGGRVLAVGRPLASLIEGADAEDLSPFTRARKAYPPLAPGSLTRGVSEIVMTPAARWAIERGDQLAQFGDPEETVVVSWRKGTGEIIWWAGATPLTNTGLREADNLGLLLNAVGPADDTTVLWDEYLHGHRGSLAGFLGRTPLPWGLAQAGLLALAACWTFSRRSGPVRGAWSPSRLSPLEFVETMGGLYARASAAPAAVEVALRRFRWALARRLGLPAGAGIVRLAGAARDRLGADGTLLETLRSCAAAALDARLDDAGALRLVQALHDQTRALGLSARLPEDRI